MKTNIYNSCKPFFCILKIFGLVPFGFHRKTKSFKITIGNTLWLILSIVEWANICWLLIKDINNGHYVFDMQSNFLDVFRKYQNLLQNFLTIFVLIFNILKRKSIERLAKLIDVFDQRIEGLGWYSMTQGKSFLITSVTFWVIFVGQIFYAAYGMIQFHHKTDALSVIKILDHLIISLFFFVLTLQFILSAHCIKVRLVTLTYNVR